MQPKRIGSETSELAREYLDGATARRAELKRRLGSRLRAVGCDRWLVDKAISLALDHPHIMSDLRELYAATTAGVKQNRAGYFHNGLRRLCRRHGLPWDTR